MPLFVVVVVDAALSPYAAADAVVFAVVVLHTHTPNQRLFGGMNDAGFGFLALFRPLKIREEADPFSLDMGVMERGSIVKVLEVNRYKRPHIIDLPRSASLFFFSPCVI